MQTTSTPQPNRRAERIDASSLEGNHDKAPIGMLLLDVNYPLWPTTPGGPPISEVPVRSQVVAGCTVDRLVYDGDDGLEEPLIAAARKLVDEGARAITGNCGFFIRHQAAVSNAVDVPVLLSGLLLAPFLLSCMGSHKKLGIVTASGPSLSQAVLRQAGIADPQRVVVADLADQPAFRAAALDCTGEYDMSAIERETVHVTSSLVREHPDIAAVLFECTALPPYAAATERSVGVPVFDVVRLIELFGAAFAPPAVQRVVVEGHGVGWLAAEGD